MKATFVCRLHRALVVVATLSFFLSPIAAVISVNGQAKPAFKGKIVASLNFDPEVDGFGFPNYPNDEYKHDGSRDMGAVDMIRMFGAKAVCKNGKAAGCVMKASAKKWMDDNLDSMTGGHCEGMAVSCLRFNWEMPFKGRSTPGDYQKGIENPFELKLDKMLANNIAYYWATQALDEVSELDAASQKDPPVKTVQKLIQAFKDGSETYTIGICQREKTECEQGHAVTPFAVEDIGSAYKIHIYDNNGPGETRFMTVQKAGKQAWSYITSTNPSEAKFNYKGDISTKSLSIVPTSQREGSCFAAPFDQAAEVASGCSTEVYSPAPVAAGTGATKPKTVKRSAAVPGLRKQYADFFLTGDGDMMIVDGRNRRLGYDPEKDAYFNEIPGGKSSPLKGGRGFDMPHYKVPYAEKGDPYVVVFSGADLEAKSVFDFVFTGPNFSVGFADIRLDPDEFMVAAISADGQRLAMELSKDGEMPDVSYAIDTEGKSYTAEIRPSLPGGLTGKQAADWKANLPKKGQKDPPQVVIDFTDANELEISDNIEGDSSYEVSIEQFDSSGKTAKIDLHELGKSDGADSYQINIADWDGGGDIGIKTDDDSDGFDDEEEVQVNNEDNDIPDDDGDGQFMSFLFGAYGR